jgi:protein-S-isoprenylcysteine O-methyltransferase Ste14
MGWRHLLSILLLPGTVTGVVPALIVRDDAGLGHPALVAAGALLLAAGLALGAWTVVLFARVGRGTLAPWDPTRRLVVEGPYRHVRNPMISAVLTILLGEAALTGSRGILIWFGCVFALNWAYFVLHEEPGLVRRFGDEYVAYRRAVPRWLPRRTPWAPGHR